MIPRKGIHIIPSLFTTGNVFCGFYSFIAALNENYNLAAWAIILAILFDILDGRIARMTKTTSAFGMQYDSLADVISFGMAPAFLCYSWILKPFDRIGWMAAFLFLLCAALRLARFNATKADIQGQLKAEGKPEQIWDKIVPGKIERFISDNTTLDQEQCLLDQNFIKDENKNVTEYIKSYGDVAVSDFKRVALG